MYHETRRAVEKRDGKHAEEAAKLVAAGFDADYPDIMRRNLIDRVYQIGDGREPATVREDKALARWIEIDDRRYVARGTGKPFQFTAAERQLKTRLLKAGLITNKKQWKQPGRERRKMREETMVAQAKTFAAAGHPEAKQWLDEYQLGQDRAKWQKRERMLRKLEPKTLLAAAADAMQAKGVRLSLDKLWRDFIEAYDATSPEKQEAFCAGKPARVAAYLQSRSVDP